MKGGGRMGGMKGAKMGSQRPGAKPGAKFGAKPGGSSARPAFGAKAASNHGVMRGPNMGANKNTGAAKAMIGATLLGTSGGAGRPGQHGIQGGHQGNHQHGGHGNLQQGGTHGNHGINRPHGPSKHHPPNQKLPADPPGAPRPPAGAAHQTGTTRTNQPYTAPQVLVNKNMMSAAGIWY